ncbi:MAG TPA: DnaB-like helicase C-terminal domain-containing protein, partial [Nitrospira sp.]|nr:DnaB-like helicase C-terminal domain-containing protein [Nitrospira sp.]
FYFDSDVIRNELTTRLSLFGSRMTNIIIKEVPPRTLSTNALRTMLDGYEQAENFIPDLLIVDSFYMLKDQHSEYRISLGRNMEDLRAIAVERNIAVVASHQLSKEGAKAKVPTAKNIGEDWSIAQTADVVIIHAATDAERKYGLARLYADKVRGAKDKFACLISQSYDIGQYCLQSFPLQKSYWDLDLMDDEDVEGDVDEE